MTTVATTSRARRGRSIVAPFQFQAELFHAELFHAELFHAELFHAEEFHAELFHAELFHAELFHAEDWKSGVCRTGSSDVVASPE
jgi:hypothetical protein